MVSAFKEVGRRNRCRYFESLAPSYKRQYIGWIAAAKLEDTQKKRIKVSIQLLENKKKLGMK